MMTIIPTTLKNVVCVLKRNFSTAATNNNYESGDFVDVNMISSFPSRGTRTSGLTYLGIHGETSPTGLFSLETHCDQDLSSESENAAR
jgi:hypothetical protein